MKKLLILQARRFFDKLLQVRKIAKYYHYESRRFQLIDHILNDTQPGVSGERYADYDFIVSLTTYGKRLYDVAFTIESIMQQSMKANRIVLWLDESFRGKTLPKSLQNQQKRGLEIAFCKDIRSYKKIIPSLKKFPDNAIITIDDDILYDYDVLERLIMSHKECPQYIQAIRVHRIILDSHHVPVPYNKWTWNSKETGPHRLNFLTGGAGALYPPHCFDDEVFNERVFMDICPYADDVWLNAMALKNNVLVNKVYTREYVDNGLLVNAGVQDIGLNVTNIQGKKLNDQQLSAVLGKYNLYKNFKSC